MGLYFECRINENRTPSDCFFGDFAHYNNDNSINKYLNLVIRRPSVGTNHSTIYPFFNCTRPGKSITEVERHTLLSVPSDLPHKSD